MSYMCPYCMWPSMRMSPKKAVDTLGNQFWHSYCKSCGTEATFIKKNFQGLTGNSGLTGNTGVEGNTGLTGKQSETEVSKR